MILFASLLAITWYCHSILVSEQDREVGAQQALQVAVLGFLAASVAVTVAQSVRVAHRVAGPEYRLIQAIRQLRSGDLSKRVQLRSGDLLTGLAAECNELIEWLNQMQPAGCKTGTDVIELEVLSSPEAIEPEPVGAGQP